MTQHQAVCFDNVSRYRNIQETKLLGDNELAKYTSLTVSVTEKYFNDKHIVLILNLKRWVIRTVRKYTLNYKSASLIAYS